MPNVSIRNTERRDRWRGGKGHLKRRQTGVEREYIPWKNLNLMIGNILFPVDTDYA